MPHKASIVILSFNRPIEIYCNVRELCSGLPSGVEIIVVDNASEKPVQEVLSEFDGRVRTIRLQENIGVAGRNVGIGQADSDIVITLDDDVFGFDAEALKVVTNKFLNNAAVAAINFQVIDDVTEAQINWIHHRKVEDWGSREFETYEISEGAVALRKSALEKVGLYPHYFFISHEGPDLALRMIKKGYRVLYSPDIQVRHAHAEGGRVDWRRYYYDARNLIWLALRHYPLMMGLRKVTLELGALFVYSVRDGYLKYWLRGVTHALRRAGSVYSEREVLSREASLHYHSLERNNPSLCYMIKKRLLQKQIGI